MSANFPPGVSENGVDPSSRRSDYNDIKNDIKSAAKQSGEALRNDLASLKSDLDSLVSRAATLSERELNDAYSRLMTRFSSIRFAAKGMAAEAGRQFSQGVDVTTDYVKDRPLQAVAMAAGVGVIVGILLGRR